MHPINAKDFDLDSDAVKGKLKIINNTPGDITIKKILVVRLILAYISALNIHLQGDATWDSYPEVGIVYTTGNSENVGESNLSHLVI